MSADREAEAALLENLHLRHAELATLFDECSSHWGFEDPVYRFYHQSFKVYAVQEQTVRIVGALESLVPDRMLNAWFRQIVAEGTGRTFRPEDNDKWTALTRPVLEAFFHARFFLEMAVRYADLRESPTPLPSGYAALLYLYDLP